jgi:hypothetical protein
MCVHTYTCIHAFEHAYIGSITEVEFERRAESPRVAREQSLVCVEVINSKTYSLY